MNAYKGAILVLYTVGSNNILKKYFSNRGCARIMVIVNHIKKKVTPSYTDTYLVSSLVLC